MTDKDRSSLPVSRARRVLLAILIITGALVAVILVRGRSPNVTASVLPSNVPAEAQPVIKQHSDNPPPKANRAATVEICGQGKIPIEGSDPGAINRHIFELAQGAGTRWLSAMQNSDDLRARLAGLLLEGKITRGDSLHPIAEQTRDAAVQLAAGTVDPAVYAIAMSMCGTYAGTGTDSCQQISLRRWAQLDPNNAVPWLLLAGYAHQRHNEADEADAFSRAAKANKVDSYSDSLYAFAESELPSDVTPLERSALAMEVIGVEAASWMPQYGIASQHCSTEAMRDSWIQQQCNSLADLLVTKGTNLLDLSTGKKIGARAGWSSERVNQLTQEQSALMQVTLQETPSDNDELWTCEGVSRFNAYTVQRARLGEVGADRALLERSGETVPELAQKFTEYVENIRRNAMKEEQESAARSSD